MCPLDLDVCIPIRLPYFYLLFPQMQDLSTGLGPMDGLPQVTLYVMIAVGLQFVAMFFIGIQLNMKSLFFKRTLMLFLLTFLLTVLLHTRVCVLYFYFSKMKITYWY